MTRARSTPLPGIAGVCLAAVVVWTLSNTAARAGDAWADLSVRPDHLVGTLSCSSVSCHGQIEAVSSSANSHGQAYHLWVAGDPHARAGLRMVQPRFQEVLRRASRRPNGATDPLVYAQCAKCHDPLGSAESSRLTLVHFQREKELSPGRGISCESCHGAGREWISRHFEQGISREELHELGMIDTKNVLTRARLCASCHVGSAENDVTHDMLAAGHPPLRFEMASHQAVLERKHWDDSARRQAQPEYEVQLWAAGRIASAEAALALLEARAKRATDETQIGTEKGTAAWPELAEYNCYECHQALRQEVGKLTLDSLSIRTPGVPPWQRWNVECVVPQSTAFAEALARLRGEMEKSFSPSPHAVAQLAADARAILRREIRVNETGDMLAGGAPAGTRMALDAIAARGDDFSWERACHELAALVAVQTTQGRAGAGQTAGRIAQSLRFTRADSEWPAALADLRSAEPRATGTMSLTEIRQELDAWRQELAGR